MPILLSLSLLLNIYTDEFSIVRKASERILEQQADQGFQGSALISYRDSVLVNNGYGYTSASKEFSNSPETLFNIASMSKTVTAIAIMQLIQQEKLISSTPLKSLFFEVPVDKSMITIHQLLTHSSGLPQEYVTSNIQDGAKAMKKIWKTRLEFKPGTDFGYSNLNYQVLARIVELLSEQSFEAYCHERIFGSTGMTNTFFWNEIDHKDSKTVAQKLEPFKGNYQDRNWDFLGSGGLFSCSSDLLSFYSAFKSGLLISSSTQKEMLQEHFKIRDGLFMGYGWFISTAANGQLEYWTRGNESFGHNGVLRWFPEQDLVIIVQSNTGEKGSSSQTDNRIVSDDLLLRIFKKLKWE